MQPSRSPRTFTARPRTASKANSPSVPLAPARRAANVAPRFVLSVLTLSRADQSLTVTTHSLPCTRVQLPKHGLHLHDQKTRWPLALRCASQARKRCAHGLRIVAASDVPAKSDAPWTVLPAAGGHLLEQRAEARSEATNNAEWQQHPRRKDGALTTRRPHRHYRAFRCQRQAMQGDSPCTAGLQAPAVPCHALARWTENASPLPPPPSRLASDERMRRRINNARRAVAAGDAPSPKPSPHDSAGGQREATATVSTQVSRPDCWCTAFRARRGLRSAAASAHLAPDRQHRTYQCNKMPRRRRCQAKLRFALQSLRSGSTSPHAKKQPGRHAAQAPAAQTPAQARSRRAPAANDRPGKMQSENNSDWPQRTEATPSLHGGAKKLSTQEPRNHSRRPIQLQHEGVALHGGRSWR
ncbi:hypothetical protein ERJ75_001155100 [Trypanosoma vivax]|nr:hypothetical protein ERJ75_001155100 [Trypanosoma vivax]